jgi:hypothetical protein
MYIYNYDLWKYKQGKEEKIPWRNTNELFKNLNFSKHEKNVGSYRSKKCL